MGKFNCMLALLLLVVSCDFFLSEEQRTERAVDQKLGAIDWDSVDQYPLFDECNEMAEKAGQLQCFQQQMLRRVEKAFEGANFKVEQMVADTLYVDLRISENGFVTILAMGENSLLNEAMPNLREEVSERLNDLTTVAPALKRGVPVSIRVRLPLVIDTEK